jgi:hypothetical protein
MNGSSGLKLRGGEITTTYASGLHGTLKRRVNSLEAPILPVPGLVVGCGIDSQTRQPFWTVNGQLVAVLFEKTNVIGNLQASDVESSDMFTCSSLLGNAFS